MIYNKIVKEKLKKLKDKKEITILAIESSCDETSCSISINGSNVLSNVISSQIEIHKKYGGVVPEIASRNHINNINNVVENALKQANKTLKDIDVIAVTYGAGLSGALMVGVNYAKALAYSLGIPIIPVNHIRAHIFSNFIEYPDLKMPFISLVVSGGHTAILKTNSYKDFEYISSTLDDAVGECFDKVARILGLSYPGGPNIEKLAKEGQANITFIKKSSLTNSLDFSFSGIKTAVINYVHTLQQKGEEIPVNDICASFQEEVCEELATKTIKACLNNNLKSIVVAGGVSANRYLKNKLIEKAKKYNIDVFVPSLKLCTDNAAMVGMIGYYIIKDLEEPFNLSFSATPNIPLC